MNLRDLIGVLGHELRTPLAAILGYQELLADGLYGELSDRQREPVTRIQQSAQQLIFLLDGLQELADAGASETDEIVAGNTSEISNALLARLGPFASSRSVKLTADPENDEALPPFRLPRLLRAAEIAFTAAIKSSHGSALRLHCARSDGVVMCTLHGAALDLNRDHPAHFDLSSAGPPPTAAQLRLAMAAATLRIVGGNLRLLPADNRVTLELSIPAGASKSSS
jgi:hypothetical protein